MQMSAAKKIGLLFAILAVLIASAAYVAVKRKPGAADDDRLSVAASFYTIAHFMEKAGGDRVAVVSITPPGVESHEFEPTPMDIKTASTARLFAFMGGGFDPWAGRISPELQRLGVATLELANHFELMEATDDEEGDGHEEGHGDGQEHGARDPHIWLDPTQAVRMTGIIRDKLIEIDPAGQDEYMESSEAFIKELTRLDQEYRAALANCSRRDIVVGHDAFRYLGARYNLNIIPISGLTSGEEPSPRRMAGIARYIREKKIEYIFIEPLAPLAAVQAVARETGVKVLELNPIEGITKDEAKSGMGYTALMKDNLSNLKKALDCR